MRTHPHRSLIRSFIPELLLLVILRLRSIERKLRAHGKSCDVCLQSLEHLLIAQNLLMLLEEIVGAHQGALEALELLPQRCEMTCILLCA